ncbi:hypothetical protein ACJMK2_011485 [Sinanodonta woodiana]|uniref:Uncharacterized protein n=1 Tax=Sinanodonta woodiana TaxID=1069815 RepID=A0ABD3V8A0_SINWO
MVQICDYSSLIFAGNITVLLILALATDYWEYRSFDKDKVIQEVSEMNDTFILEPTDTKSYFQIRYICSRKADSGQRLGLTLSESLYHPPIFVKIYRESVNITSDPPKTPGGSLPYVQYEMEIFLQYGNLFRDCDDLESDVMFRIGLQKKRKNKCVYFHLTADKSDVYRYAPALHHLEGAACACALLCIVAMVIGLLLGGYGLFSYNSCLKSFQMASCLSLTAGYLLTLGIALFHGKCSILKKIEILPGIDLPLKRVLNDSRIYSYGWSFSLAWICVFFCYTSSYVWLCKSQGSRRIRIAARNKRQTDQKNVGKRGYTQCLHKDTTAL